MESFIESQLNTQKLANCGQKYIDICFNNVTNNFWKDVFIAFKSVSSKIEDKEINFLEIPLWHNPDITIDGRSIFYENWFAKGIMYIGDLVNENLEFVSFNEFLEQINLNVNLVNFCN